MDDNFNPVGIASTEGVSSYDLGLRAHMQRVYNYVAGGLALTGILAFAVASNMQLASAIWGSPLRWLVIFAPLIIVMLMSFKLQTLSTGAMKALFFGYSGLMGLSLSILFLAYTQASIARAFFITAGTFGAMSLWGYVTKKDLTGMGGFLMMGVMGLVIAGIVNIFLMSPMMYWVTSVLGVAIFTGLTAWDTQRIKEMYSSGYGADVNDKLAVWGALRLYMDFINIFVSLLRLTGGRR